MNSQSYIDNFLYDQSFPDFVANISKCEDNF